MPSLELSSSVNIKPDKSNTMKKSRMNTLIVWALRVICGAVFIFSGWVKAVDPWGMVFKLTDYAAAVGITFSNEILVTVAFLLSAVEFAIGAMLMTSAFKRLTAWTFALFMAVMTPLTAWLFFENPVPDCGCFGDAIIISNGATFAKNIFLLAASIFLVFNNQHVKGLVTPAIQWLVLVITVAYPLLLNLYGYTIQPWVDFRPYPVGSDINTDTEHSLPKYVYAKDGIEKAFNADSLPSNDAWTFVRREEPEPSKQNKEFAILDSDNEDITSEILSDTENGLLLLCVSDPIAHGMSRSHMANQLYKYLDDRDIPMVALVSTDSLAVWVDKVSADYPVYFTDDTDLKVLVRGNAGLVYIKNGKIKWKYTFYSINPELITECNTDAKVNVLDNLEPAENSVTLKFITLIYVIAMGVFILTSLMVMAPQHRPKNKTCQSP